MSSRAPLCAWFAVCAVVVPTTASAQERPAREIVEAIVREGPRAVAIRAEVEVVRREQDARLAFPNPGVSYSREGAGFTDFLQVEQPLPLFGLRGALARAGVAATLAAEAERDARLWELRAEATRLVSRLQAADVRAEAAAADVVAVDRLIGILRVREQEGEGSRFDRLRAEQELAELKQAVVAADIEVSDTRGALAAMLPAGLTVTRVTGPFYEARPPLAMEDLTARAQSMRAELRALQRAVDRAGREADAARRARWPAPVVSGGLKRADNGDGRDRGGVLGVALAVPLFDTGARDAARWTARGVRLAAERVAIEQQVRADIARAVDALARREHALAATGADALARELVTTAEVAYREGEVGILDAARCGADGIARTDARHRDAPGHPVGADCARTRRGRRAVAVKSMTCVAMVMVLASACDRQTGAPATADAELEPLSVTRWTGKTELFAEYPPLVVGQTSRFAIDLTRLDSFKALTEGHVEVRLTGGSGPSEAFPVDAPSRPGIFGVDVKPAQAGVRELTIVLRLAGLDDEHRVGAVRVYPRPGGGALGTGGGRRRSGGHQLPEGAAVGARVRDRGRGDCGGQRECPSAGADRRQARWRGRRRGPHRRPARPRARRAGRRVVWPRGRSWRACCPRQARRESCRNCSRPRPRPRRRLQLATRDRERAERLVTAGAAPQKRLDEARAAEVQAQAWVTGADARLAQFNTTRSAGAGATDDGLFVVRAPVGGVIAERLATTGANVTAGSVLFRVVDARQVQVAGHVPEADLPRARQAHARRSSRCRDNRRGSLWGA